MPRGGPDMPRDRGPRDSEPPVQAPHDRDDATAAQSGTLSIRVQPGGATIFIDGERWAGPANDDERLIVQVPEGRHTVAVERDGFDRFVTEIDVRQGQTAPVNISLTQAR
jgi:hypothetical protein